MASSALAWLITSRFWLDCATAQATSAIDVSCQGKRGMCSCLEKRFNKKLISTPDRAVTHSDTQVMVARPLSCHFVLRRSALHGIGRFTLASDDGSFPLRLSIAKLPNGHWKMSRLWQGIALALLADLTWSSSWLPCCPLDWYPLARGGRVVLPLRYWFF